MKKQKTTANRFPSPDSCVISAQLDSYRGPIRLVLPFPTLINAARTVHRGRIISSDELRGWKKRATLSSKAQLPANWLPLGGPLSISMVTYRPRKSGDWDGPIKATCDVLNGIVWIDDSQIVRGTVERRDDKLNPRIEITTTQMKLVTHSVASCRLTTRRVNSP